MEFLRIRDTVVIKANVGRSVTKLNASYYVLLRSNSQSLAAQEYSCSHHGVGRGCYGALVAFFLPFAF